MNAKLTTLIFALTLLASGCSSSTSPGNSQNSGTVFYIDQVDTSIRGQYPDTLVFTNGVLDSERIRGVPEESMTFVSTLEPSEQVYTPDWIPFAFQSFPTDAFTYAWSPSKDTIGQGDYYLPNGTSYITLFIKAP